MLGKIRFEIVLLFFIDCLVRFGIILNFLKTVTKSHGSELIVSKNAGFI